MIFTVVSCGPVRSCKSHGVGQKVVPAGFWGASSCRTASSGHDPCGGVIVGAVSRWWILNVGLYGNGE